MTDAVSLSQENIVRILICDKINLQARIRQRTKRFFSAERKADCILPGERPEEESRDAECEFPLFYTGVKMIFLCGAFYAVLCVFSIVTGLIYMSGRRELNPLELSDHFMEKLQDPERKAAFAKKMGGVTFVVGIVQGITAYAMFKAGSPVLYGIALGFTLFSIGSVLVKLTGKINLFPLLKLTVYVIILIVLLLGSTRAMFFG